MGPIRTICAVTPGHAGVAGPGEARPGVAWPGVAGRAWPGTAWPGVARRGGAGVAWRGWARPGWARQAWPGQAWPGLAGQGAAGPGVAGRGWAPRAYILGRPNVVGGPDACPQRPSNTETSASCSSSLPAFSAPVKSLVRATNPLAHGASTGI